MVCLGQVHINGRVPAQVHLPACVSPARSVQSLFVGVPARMLQLLGALTSEGSLALGQGPGVPSASSFCTENAPGEEFAQKTHGK